MSMESKPKVLIIHNFYQIPGGEDTVVANEKKLLEDHEHEVVLYSRNNSELKLMSSIKKLLLPITTVFNPRTYIEVKKIIKEQHINIVHVHNTLNLISPAVYYAAFSCKVPVVQTIHNFRLLCPGATFYRDGHICEDCVEQGLICAVKHSCYRDSTLQTLACVISTKLHRMLGTYRKLNYICLTEFNKEKLLQLNRLDQKKQLIDPSRVYIKPNFTFDIEPDTIPSNIFSGGGVTDEYFLFVGRIEKIKGLDILLKAFALMPKQHLVIAGTGTQLKEYKAVATRNVQFVGLLDKRTLATVTAHAKAVIVPSQWYETFGMVIVEAYAAHKPVIVGDIGNIASLVDEYYTGLKFKYDSAESLKDAILSINMLNSYEMAKMAYKKYEVEFSPEENYQILKYIYKLVGK